MKKMFIGLSSICLFAAITLGAANKGYSDCPTWAGHNDGACQISDSGSTCVPAVCNASGAPCTRQM